MMSTCSGYTIGRLLCTSVEDCRGTLQYIDDIPFLRALQAECERCEHKTRAQVVRRRIRQLEKASR